MARQEIGSMQARGAAGQAVLKKASYMKSGGFGSRRSTEHALDERHKNMAVGCGAGRDGCTVHLSKGSKENHMGSIRHGCVPWAEERTYGATKQTNKSMGRKRGLPVMMCSYSCIAEWSPSTRPPPPSCTTSRASQQLWAASLPSPACWTGRYTSYLL